MRFMLDTNVCIDLIRRRSAGMLGHLQRASPGDVCVYCDYPKRLEYGVGRRLPLRTETAWRLRGDTNHRATVQRLGGACASPGSHPLDAKGSGIGPLDTLIAAHALAAGLTLVTNNESEFGPGLKYGELGYLISVLEIHCSRFSSAWRRRRHPTYP